MNPKDNIYIGWSGSLYNCIKTNSRPQCWTALMLDCPHNPMGHNKNIVLEGVLNIIPRRLLLIVQTFIKVVRLIESKVNNIYTGQSGP